MCFIMGRQSDYTIKEDKKEISLEDARCKLGKKAMSPADFVPLLKERRDYTVDEKTIRNYIKDICQESQGILAPTDFQKGKNKAYRFQSSYNELLLTLMATDYFDKRKNDARVSTRALSYEQLLNNIDMLPEELQKTIKDHPTYMSAKIECELYERVLIESGTLLGELCSVDPLMRYHFMYDFLSLLIRFRRYIQEEDAILCVDRVISAHCQYPPNKEDYELHRKAALSNTIWEFLFCLIALKMRGQDFQYITENEQLSTPAFALAHKLFYWKGGPQYQAELEKIDKEIEDNQRYQEIIAQIKNIFDINDSKEKNLFDQIKRIIQINYLRTKVSAKDLAQIYRIAEHALKAKKNEIAEDLDWIKKRSVKPQE